MMRIHEVNSTNWIYALYIYIYVCVCVCVRARARARQTQKFFTVTMMMIIIIIPTDAFVTIYVVRSLMSSAQNCMLNEFCALRNGYKVSVVQN